MPLALKLNPPFRAEHIGSLLRPRELKDAFGAHSRGQLDDAQSRAVVERCIVDAIRLQEDAGLDTTTDGEFRRVAWSTGLISALDGLSARQSLFEFHDAGGASQRWDTCFASGRLARAANRARRIQLCPRQYEAHPEGYNAGAELPAFFPAVRVRRSERLSDLDKFWADLVRIYQDELADLSRAGATYVQFDEVPQAMLCDENVRAKVRQLREDPNRLLGSYIDAVNRILARRPPGMTVGMHLCRGNLRGRWMAEGGYDVIAERLFNQLKVDGFFLEYDSARAGGFAPLRLMPANKFVRLGLISSKTAELENRHELMMRIDE